MGFIEGLGKKLGGIIHRIFNPYDAYNPDADNSGETVIPKEPVVFELGLILKGRVTHIDERYVVVKAHETPFHIDKHQITMNREVNLYEYFTSFDNIEFAVIEKKNSVWYGSVLLPDVFRKREQIKSLKKRVFNADEITIKDYKNGNLILEYNDDIEIRIHGSELPVHIQKRNSVREIRSLIKDGTLKVKKTGMFPPKDQIYHINERGRNEAYLTGTIQNFEYVASEENVNIVTHTYPFKLDVKAKRPYQLDTVSEFVIKALSEQKSVAKISQITGLKEQAIKDIREKLEHLRYLNGWRLTDKAKTLLEAIEQEGIINRNNFGAYFASSTHPMNEIITNESPCEKVAYGNNKNLYTKDIHAWEDFSNKTDRDLSYSFLKNIVTDDQTYSLTQAVMSDALSIFIRKDNKPDTLFKVSTPANWFYGGLLTKFNPLYAPDMPEDIEVPEAYCSTYLLIQYDVNHTPALKKVDSIDDEKADEMKEIEIINRVFYETNTKTIWHLKESRLNVIDIKIPVTESPISNNYALELPNGGKLSSFNNPQIKLISYL